MKKEQLVLCLGEVFRLFIVFDVRRTAHVVNHRNLFKYTKKKKKRNNNVLKFIKEQNNNIYFRFLGQIIEIPYHKSG